MTKEQILKKNWKGGGCQFYFGPSMGNRGVTSLTLVAPCGHEDEIPLKKMRAAHAAMGRAIEAWEERER